jgi:hypothetical protein
MRRVLISLSIFLLISQHVFASDGAFGGIKLLEGYVAKRSPAIDATVWTIEKKDGLKITFESGVSEGSWADPKEKTNYSWYREQQINGFLVRFALVKTGLKTVWEPDESGGRPLGNILLVSFLLEHGESSHTANFSAKLGNPQELADALLMVMTFDPSKGTF